MDKKQSNNKDSKNKKRNLIMSIIGQILAGIIIIFIIFAMFFKK